MTQDESLLEALTSVLDDALLDLREKDRVALLTRFVQQKNLKEVGAALGVNEDTAQKRVAKAVELLTGAFRKRGYNVPNVALTLAVLEGTSQAVPIGLIGTAVAAGLSVTGTASLTGTALLAAKFMSLTKTQTITASLLLGAAPVAYKWNLTTKTRAAMVQMERNVSSKAATLAELEARRAALGRDVISGDSDVAQAIAETRRLAALPREVLPPEEDLYRWSEESEYVRIPKHILNNLRLTSPATQVSKGHVIDENGNVSPVLLEALGLEAPQRAAVQQAFADFASKYDAIYKSRTYLTNAMPPGIGFSRPAGSELVTLRTRAFPEEGERLKAQLQNALEQSIGSERTEIIVENQARSDFWNEFLQFGKYDNWVSAVAQENGYYTVGRARTGENSPYGGSVNTVKYSRLPEELKPYFPAPITNQE